MKALTVQQPYASAIMRLGKTVENRGWTTPYRGPLLIHAGAGRDYLKNMDLLTAQQIEALHRDGDLPMGAALGVVEMIDCLPLAHYRVRYDPDEADPWAFGPFCWVLRSPIELASPVAMRGAQGLWEVSDAIVEQWLASGGGGAT